MGFHVTHTHRHTHTRTHARTHTHWHALNTHWTFSSIVCCAETVSGSLMHVFVCFAARLFEAFHRKLVPRICCHIQTTVCTRLCACVCLCIACHVLHAVSKAWRCPVNGHNLFYLNTRLLHLFTEIICTTRATRYCTGVHTGTRPCTRAHRVYWPRHVSIYTDRSPCTEALSDDQSHWINFVYLFPCTVRCCCLRCLFFIVRVCVCVYVCVCVFMYLPVRESLPTSRCTPPSVLPWFVDHSFTTLQTSNASNLSVVILRIESKARFFVCFCFLSACLRSGFTAV